MGIEPTYLAWKASALPLSYTRLPANYLDGRGDRIRTCDPLVPNQVRYQTALHPESTAKVSIPPKTPLVKGKICYRTICAKRSFTLDSACAR